MIILSNVSHIDHALPPETVESLLLRFRGRDAFFIDTISLEGEHAPWLVNALYGPLAGDAPVAESDVHYAVRDPRRWASRMVKLPTRFTRLLTIVAGPVDEHPCVLYTAYGGPAAPREPGDPSLGSFEEIRQSREFWSQHALAALDHG